MRMDQNAFNQGLINFIEASPTPYHATTSMTMVLEQAGFIALDEKDEWDIELGGRYYVTRNDSSLIAFQMAERFDITDGIRMVAAHTDSPCLKLKPKTLYAKEGYLQFNVEVYGGALLAPWYDRDLGVAGKVWFINKEGERVSDLITIAKPVAIIPSLAIHLDREANQNKTINAQNDISPVLGLTMGEIEDKFDFEDLLAQALTSQGHEVEQVLDYDLSLFDIQKPGMVGANQDFIASARLDNLLSCYTGLLALMNADRDLSCMLICTDHEEVGSKSFPGADGDFVEKVLRRITPDVNINSRLIANSMMVSTDNAHAVHPNFVGKHDHLHKPQMNKGLVVKTNANQRYASSSETQSIFKAICLKEGLPMQYYNHRNDLPCGSTIGPMSAAKLGIRTLDIGVPTLGMHSIRELAGSQDAYSMYLALTAFCDTQDL